MKDRENLILFSLLVFTLVLRVYNLENFPRWYVDEGTYAKIGMNILEGVWGYKTWGPNFFPPILPVITGFLIKIFGKSYSVIRMTGVLSGTFSVLLTYLIGKKLYNKKVALLASIILSVSGLFINRMVLMDNLVEFFFLLTILSYLNSEKKGMWLWLMGISSGLAFLSKYTGLVCIVFITIQSFLDKRLKSLKTPLIIFFIFSLIYPILGLIFDWNGFVFDTLFQARRKISYEFLHTFILQPPYYFLHPTFKTFYFWTFLGFIGTIYLLLRTNKKNSGRSEIILFTAFLSFFFICVMAKNVWWAYLIIIYPIYTLSTAVLINDALEGRRVALLFFMLPIALKSLSDTVVLSILCVSFTFFLVLLVGIKIVGSNRTRPRIWMNRSLILFTILLLSYLFMKDMVRIGDDVVQDLREVVSFINSNINETDMVASNPNIMWLLDGIGVDYAQMAFYTTKEYTYLYPLSLYPRFKMNITLENFRYVVLDYPKWLKYNVGWSKSVEHLTPRIQNEWKLVFQKGRVWVYENPVKE